MDAEPPMCAVPPRTAIVSPAPAEVRPVVTVRVAAAGWHVHRCPNGHEWSHPDTAKGNRDEHTCPVCRVVLPAPWMPTDRGVRLEAVAVGPKSVVPVRPVSSYVLPAASR